MIELTVNIANIESVSNRPYGGDGDIALFAEDIKRNGIIHPITVKGGLGMAGDTYLIVAGRRRLAAAKLLGWKTIKAHALEPHEMGKADDITASENINRLNMHPLDEAVLFKRMLEHGEPIEELAKRCDRTKAAIWQRIQLLDLTDDIKTMFRNGRLSLHAAAMLKVLDAEQQKKFVDKFCCGDSDREISEFEIENFIKGIFHYRLYKCVAGPECKTCQKRTYYSNKELFPELDGNTFGDKCLDHDCYMAKWIKLLSNRIKSVKREHKDHAGASLIVTQNDGFKKIFGKGVTVDGVGYGITSFTYDGTRPLQKPEAGAMPCFDVELDNSGKLLVHPRYWKEPEKKKSAEKVSNPIAPLIKLAELPKEEAAAATAALEKSCKSPDAKSRAVSDIEDKVQEKVLARLMERVLKQPDDDKYIDRYLDEWLDFDSDHWDAVKLFTGKDNDVKALRKLSWPKLFACLCAGDFSYYDLPALEKMASVKQNKIADFAGVSMEELRRMYKEEIRALLPKPTTEAKPAKQPAAEKKTTRGKGK